MMPWIEKAEEGLEVASLIASSAKFRESVGFHCQQAAEKYLKAFLTHVQVEFRKTHDIVELQGLAATGGMPGPLSEEDAKWLNRFGGEIRRPNDVPEMLPGDELRAIDLATRVKQAVLARLGRS